jgi:hypothetical protein
MLLSRIVAAGVVVHVIGAIVDTETVTSLARGTAGRLERRCRLG